MKKIKHYHLALLILAMLVAILTACNRPHIDTEAAQLAESELASQIIDNVRTLPFFADTVSMEVLSFSEDSIQIKLVNNSDIGVSFHSCSMRRGMFGGIPSVGIFAVYYLDGHDWRIIVPSTRELVYPIPSEYAPILIVPGNYEIAEFCLALYSIPKTDAGLYRLKMDVFVSLHYVTPEINQAVRELYIAAGRRMFYTRNRYRHTLVAEFYWHGE